MKKLILAVIVMLSSACSQGGSGSTPAASGCGSKNLLSLWHSNPGSIPFDFTNVQLGQPTSMTLFFQTHTCEYDMVMIGTQCSGSIVINNPILLNGAGSCAEAVGTFSYTKQVNQVLTICDASNPSDCTQFN